MHIDNEIQNIILYIIMLLYAFICLFICVCIYLYIYSIKRGLKRKIKACYVVYLLCNKIAIIAYNHSFINCAKKTRLEHNNITMRFYKCVLVRLYINTFINANKAFLYHWYTFIYVRSNYGLFEANKGIK